MEVQIVLREDFDRIAADVAAQYFARGQAVICFAAGQTPLGMYDELVRRYRAGEIDPSGITAFTLDEYAGLPRDHPRSCFHKLYTRLYQGLGLHDGQIVTYDTSLPPERAANLYEERLRSLGGLDLCILGIGLNGHVGFNEPGTPWEVRTHVAPLAPETLRRLQQDGWTDPPSVGLTLGIQTLMESRQVLLLANGAHKSSVIERLLASREDASLPASWFHDHPNCLLLLDEDAAPATVKTIDS
jgi:glucosamine-6-phosphate deaminase